MNMTIFSLIALSITFIIIVFVLLVKRKSMYLQSILFFLGIVFLGMKYVRLDFIDALYSKFAYVDIVFLVYSSILTIFTCITIPFKTKNEFAINKDSGAKEDLSYIESFNFDCGVANKESGYVTINEKFKKSLNLSEEKIKIEDIHNRVYASEKDMFNHLEGDYRICYHLDNGNLYEEVSEEGKTTISLIEKKQVKSLFLTYKDLEREILFFKENKMPYGLILCNVKDIYKMVQSNFKESIIIDAKERDKILKQYVDGKINGVYGDSLKAYRLSSREFCFFISSKHAYDLIEDELYTHKSEFMQIKDNEVIVDFCVGLVFSDNVDIKDKFDVINAGFEMIQLAASKSFTQDFAIYSPSRSTQPEYKLKDLGIDLENDLKEYLNNDEE